MTLLEAKDEIAKKYGYSNWQAFVRNEVHKHATTTFWCFINEAAELYANEKDHSIAFGRWILKEGIEKSFDGNFITWKYGSSLFDEFPEGFYDTHELYEIFKHQMGIK